MSSESEPEAISLARERTALAYERTLMAWIRTAGSLITFGFGIYKFAYYMHTLVPGRHPRQMFGARAFGLALICIGIIALVLVGWQHHGRLKSRPTLYRQTQVTFVIGALVVTVGLMAFTALILRM